MRAPNFISRLTLALSILLVSYAITGGLCLPGASDIAAQARFSASSSTTPDKQPAKNASAVNTGRSPSASSITPEPPMPDDPYLSQQWALSQIQVARVWPITTGDPGVVIAVLDTGIDRDHEDISGKVVAEANYTDSPIIDDLHGHGTHIAGIAAASSGNGIGIAGLAPQSRLMNVKVANDKGRCQAKALAKGITWAVDNGASVINISLVLQEPSAELEAAVNYAWSHGAVIVAAAGNDGSQLLVYPASYENSIAVAAIQQDNTLAPLSNYGDWVDVAAPGFNIYSTLPDDGYGYKSGTSFAAAYVSGLAALLFSTATDINGNSRLNDEVRAAIEAGCQDTGIDGTGKGQIDAAMSIAEINLCR